MLCHQLSPSVCTKIHDEVDGFSASSDYWLRFLYEGENGDPEDVEKGFLKGQLLVKVRLYFLSDPYLTTCSIDLQSHLYVTILSRREPFWARQPLTQAQIERNWPSNTAKQCRKA